jgi:hypothetical protein
MTDQTAELEALETEYPYLVQETWRPHPDGYAAADRDCLAACRAVLEAMCEH